MVKMHDGLYDDMKGNFEFNVEYKYVENQLNIELIDSRSVADQYYGHVAEVLLFSDEDLLTEKWGGVKLNKDEINSMSQIIRLTKSTFIKIPLWENIFTIQIQTYTRQEIYIYIVVF